MGKISFSPFWQVMDVCGKNKAGYTATLVACGWAGAIIEVSGTFGLAAIKPKPPLMPKK